jgi:transposase
MWLTGRSMPDFKTIANFRKDNGKVIRAVCLQFVMLCQLVGLFSETLIAIDDSKFKAASNRDRNFIRVKLQRSD